MNSSGADMNSSFRASWTELTMAYAAASYLSITSVMCSGEVWHSAPEVVIGGGLASYFAWKALAAAAAGLQAAWNTRFNHPNQMETQDV